jgi:RNA polymerase sigma-70 factor (ECF subfamily)
VVTGSGGGAHWALTELFRANQPSLVRYLRAKEPSVADDLAGEVWIAVSRGLPSFVGDEHAFRRWLFTIARRRVIEHRRRAARRRTDPHGPERFDLPAELRDGGDPAALVVEGLCAQDAVDLLVADLSPDQAEVLLLRVVAGLDVADVASIMKRSPGAVRVLQHRALRRLALRFSTGALTR